MPTSMQSSSLWISCPLWARSPRPSSSIGKTPAILASKNLSLLKKNSACKGCNYHLLACFIFRWGRRRRGWVAQFGAAMWSGLKYNSYTQPGKRATLPYGSSLHSCPSFWRLKIRIPGKQLRNIKFLMISKIPNMDQTDPCLLANSKSHVKPHRSN